MKIEQKKLDLGTTLNNAFEIYKKTFLTSGLAFLIITLVILLIAFIGIQYFIGFEAAAQQLKTFDPASLSPKGTIIYITCVLIITVLIAPFTAGILKMMQDADANEEVNLSTLFYYVNSSYFSTIIFAIGLLTLFSIGINLGIQKICTDKTTGSIVAMVLSFIYSILTFLTLPNIIFKELSIKNAIEDSVQFSSKNFIQIVLLLILAIVFGYFGIIAFCVGIFFTFPIYFAMQFSIYKSSL